MLRCAKAMAIEHASEARGAPPVKVDAEMAMADMTVREELCACRARRGMEIRAMTTHEDKSSRKKNVSVSQQCTAGRLRQVIN